MTNKRKFIEMPQDWHKRRIPTEKKPTLINYEVIDFEKINNHACKMNVTFSDGSSDTLNARVHCNRIYGIDVDPNERWTVQGINHTGTSVLLKLIE